MRQNAQYKNNVKQTYNNISLATGGQATYPTPREYNRMIIDKPDLNTSPDRNKLTIHIRTYRLRTLEYVVTELKHYYTCTKKLHKRK